MSLDKLLTFTVVENDTPELRVQRVLTANKCIYNGGNDWDREWSTLSTSVQMDAVQHAVATTYAFGSMLMSGCPVKVSLACKYYIQVGSWYIKLMRSRHDVHVMFLFFCILICSCVLFYM